MRLPIGTTLVACAALVAAPAAARNAETGASHAPAGRIVTEAGAYSFAPSTHCALFIEDGEPDIEIAGPGTGPDGEKIFVELSSTAQTVTIGLGVDTPFTSSEHHLSGGAWVTEPFEVELDGRTVRVASMILADSNGERLSGVASLEVTCPTL